MITPLVDTLCCGGVSLVVVPLVLLYVWSRPEQIDFSFHVNDLLITSIFINWPHFMASYRILYGKPENANKHRGVSIVLPIILIGVILYAMATANQDPMRSAQQQAGVTNESGSSVQATQRQWVNPRVLKVLSPLAPLLLAWHYTGQSWGMTAAFAFIGGIRIRKPERWLIRSGYYSLLVYHVIWVVVNTEMLFDLGVVHEGIYYGLKALLKAWRIVVVLAFLLGLYGFQRLRQQNEKPIPIRCWLPWVATFSWYMLIDVYPNGFLFLQVFHALQYLIFPLRVEMNDFAGTHSANRAQQIRHVVVYYLYLVGIGIVVFKTPEWLQDPGLEFALIVSAAINVHHYFIDGVIWKIRRPEVRQSLFGHLTPAEAK